MGFLCIRSLVRGRYQTFNLLPFRSAGHAHWQNVAGIKKEKSAEINANKLLLMRMAKVALIDGRGIKDPAVNQHLKKVFDKAKALKISPKMFDRFLSKASGSSDSFILEARAPGGLFVLIQSSADSKINEKNILTSVAKKFGLKIEGYASSQITDSLFNHTGYVSIEPTKEVKTSDDALELALECECSDVNTILSDEDGSILSFEFECLPTQVNKLESQLSDMGYSVLDASTRYSPINPIPVTEETYQQLLQAFSKFRDTSDSIENIFHNAEVQ